MANHDTKAFEEHVHPHAVFVEDDDAELKGRAAIVDGWKDILAGEKLSLHWSPATVELTGDGRVALSRGPYWVEVHKPGVPTKFLSGVYQSTWVLDTDNIWRVAIDGGTPPPVASSEQEIEKLRSKIPTQCPSK